MESSSEGVMMATMSDASEDDAAAEPLRASTGSSSSSDAIARPLPIPHPPVRPPSQSDIDRMPRWVVVVVVVVVVVGCDDYAGSGCA